MQRMAFEAAIRRGGVGVKAERRGVRRGLRRGRPRARRRRPPMPVPAHVSARARAADGRGRRLSRAGPHLSSAPASSALADYQDVAYARDYLDRLKPVAEADRSTATARAAARRDRARAGARHGLRGHRPGRRAEDPARAASSACARRCSSPTGRSWRSPSSCIRACRRSPTRCRPASAAGCCDSGWPRRLLERFTQKGLVLKTSTIRGFLMLYVRRGAEADAPPLAALPDEQAFLNDWLQTHPRRRAATNYALAAEIAHDPHAGEGLQRHPRARPAALRHADADAAAASWRLPDPAAALAKLRKAALADDTGAALAAAIKDIRPLPQAAE